MVPGFLSARQMSASQLRSRSTGNAAIEKREGRVAAVPPRGESSEREGLGDNRAIEEDAC